MTRHVLSNIIDDSVVCIPSSSLYRQKIPEPPPTFVSQCFIRCNTYYMNAIEDWLDDNILGAYYVMNDNPRWGTRISNVEGAIFHHSNIYFEFREDAVLFLVSHK